MFNTPPTNSATDNRELAIKDKISKSEGGKGRAVCQQHAGRLSYFHYYGETNIERLFDINKKQGCFLSILFWFC